MSKFVSFAFNLVPRLREDPGNQVGLNLKSALVFLMF